jgi:hypothetical protein
VVSNMCGSVQKAQLQHLLTTLQCGVCVRLALSRASSTSRHCPHFAAPARYIHMQTHLEQDIQYKQALHEQVAQQLCVS